MVPLYQVKNTGRESLEAPKSALLPENFSELEEKVIRTGAQIASILNGLETVIKGKRGFLEKVLAGILAGGHILIEDVPGTGKTTVAKTLSHLIKGLHFSRIQFTPDLLPYDITGVDVWDASQNNFTFRPGPLFANILLADEINRTTPKVQSALLEVMAESQVTVGNSTYQLKEPFFVLATQNPIEMEGTYPLPAAQLDRFLMKLNLGYPELESEYSILRQDPSATLLPELKPVISAKDFLNIRKTAREIYCDDRLLKCAADIAVKTREHKAVRLGVSTRGALMLLAACRAYALVKGRAYIIDQDIADLAPLVYAHRVILKGNMVKAEELIREVALNEIARVIH